MKGARAANTRLFDDRNHQRLTEGLSPKGERQIN